MQKAVESISIDIHSNPNSKSFNDPYISKELTLYKSKESTFSCPNCIYEKPLNGFEIIKAESFEAVNELRADWEMLLNKFHLSNVYITPDFYLRLFNSRVHGATPNIILFKKDNEPKAMLVGWKLDTKVSCKIGYIKTETPKLKTLEIEIGGLITSETSESEKILEKYLCNIIDKNEVELISIDHLSATNPCWTTIKNKISVNKKAVYRDSIKWKARIQNSKTGEIFNLFNKKTEQKFRRKDRKIQKFFNNNIQLKIVTANDDILTFMENASTVDKNSYHKAMGISVEIDEHYNTMFSSLAGGGYFRGYILLANSKPIAYYYGVLYEKMFYAFSTSYNAEHSKLSPGIYLLRRMIENLIDENIDVIHFGYGDSPYKRMFGTESVEEATFRIYSSGIKARYSRFLDITTLTTTYKISEFLNRLHLLNKIKKSWRNKLLQKKVA